MQVSTIHEQKVVYGISIGSLQKSVTLKDLDRRSGPVWPFFGVFSPKLSEPTALNWLKLRIDENKKDKVAPLRILWCPECVDFDLKFAKNRKMEIWGKRRRYRGQRKGAEEKRRGNERTNRTPTDIADHYYSAPHIVAGRLTAAK